MSRTRCWTSLLLVLSCLAPPMALAQNDGTASEWKAGIDGWCERTVGGQIDESIIVIDHSKNHVVCPVATPLKVRDGKFVRALILLTHPNSFSYRLSAIEAPTLRDAGATTGKERVQVPPDEVTFTSLSLRHDRHISQYTIDITPVEGDEVKVAPPAAERRAVEREVLTALRSSPQVRNQTTDSQLEEAAEEITTRAYGIGPSRPELEEMVEEEVAEITPDLGEAKSQLAEAIAEDLEEEVEPEQGEQMTLRPFKFTIEVETAGPELTFTSGFAFSDLISSRYFLAPDNKGTAAPEDDTLNVQKDDRGEDVEPDVMALINIRWPDLKNQFWNKVGVAFGLGLNGDNEPRYFLGPSFTLPRGFVFTAGLSGGDVKILPAGQGVGRPLLNGGNTLPSLDTDFKVGYHVGISFGFTNRENDVVSHLNGLTVTQNPAGQSPPQRTPGDGNSDGDDDDNDDDDNGNDDDDDGDDDGGGNGADGDSVGG